MCPLWQTWKQKDAHKGQIFVNALADRHMFHPKNETKINSHEKSDSCLKMYSKQMIFLSSALASMQTAKSVNDCLKWISQTLASGQQNHRSRRNATRKQKTLAREANGHHLWLHAGWFPISVQQHWGPRETDRQLPWQWQIMSSLFQKNVTEWRGGRWNPAMQSLSHKGKSSQRTAGKQQGIIGFAFWQIKGSYVSVWHICSYSANRCCPPGQSTCRSSAMSIQELSKAITRRILQSQYAGIWHICLEWEISNRQHVAWQ